MKPASGDTESGGDIKPWPVVDGLSLDMLCVLDRIFCEGEASPGEVRDMVCSTLEKDMMESVGEDGDLNAGPVICETNVCWKLLIGWECG